MTRAAEHCGVAALLWLLLPGGALMSSTWLRIRPAKPKIISLRGATIRSRGMAMKKKRSIVIERTKG